MTTRSDVSLWRRLWAPFCVLCRGASSRSPRVLCIISLAHSLCLGMTKMSPPAVGGEPSVGGGRQHIPPSPCVAGRLGAGLVRSFLGESCDRQEGGLPTRSGCGPIDWRPGPSADWSWGRFMFGAMCLLTLSLVLQKRRSEQRACESTPSMCGCMFASMLASASREPTSDTMPGESHRTSGSSAEPFCKH